MGQGHLPDRGSLRPGIALGTVLALAVAAPAQVQMQERRAYARLCELRAAVGARYQLADAAGRDAILTALASDAQGVPFVPPLRALAAAAGVVADAEYLFRGALQVFALPEVVDPAVMADLAVTVHLPYHLPCAGKLEFDVTVCDCSGQRPALTKSLPQAPTVDDLLRFRATLAWPCASLPNGEYELVVTPRIDGRGPRPHDLELRVGFAVQRGFVARAVALQAEVQRRAPTLPPAQGAFLRGAAHAVDRVYRGEPRQGTAWSDDLRHAETVLHNLVAGRAPWDGLAGCVMFGLPAAGDEVLLACSEFPGPSPQAELWLAMGGAPAFDARLLRPTSPEATAPQWLCEQLLPWICKEPARRLVVLESPGRVRELPRALASATSALRTWFPGAPRQIWLGEREGALALVAHAAATPSPPAGLVLAVGGAVSGEEFARLVAGHVAVLGVFGAQDHPANENLRRIGLLAAQDAAAGPWVRFAAAPVPWAFALAAAGADIDRFTASLPAPAASRPASRR